MQDLNRNRPYTVNQIKTEKPNAESCKAVLQGYIANSMNGGHNKVIAYKKVMAGEKHYEYRLKANFQMLTPLTPTYQNLVCTIRTYFVPNSRVWTNAEKYTAQKKNNTEAQITVIPNIGGKIIGSVQDEANDGYINITNTDIWRDHWMSSYIPRLGEYEILETSNSTQTDCVLPKMNALLLRGRIAIFNDYERNKEYQSALQEFKGDTVTVNEWNSYYIDPTNLKETDFMRAKKQNSYFTNYRLNYQGIEEAVPTGLGQNLSFVKWASWESKIAEARSEAQNAQKNDWDIIAEIRGSKKLTEGKVQLIGQQTFNLNYAAITQSTYNNNETIAEEFRVMGKQGAYSYTEVDIPLYAGFEFHEEGFIHVIATVSADTVYEKGFDRNLLNVTPLEEYRPDMQGDKFDVLYKIEMETTKNSIINNPVLGFKRKYSELFKLPNVIGGDMTTDNYATWEWRENRTIGETITQKTYQFFEQELNKFRNIDGTLVPKKEWLDYTDLMINKNQAILNPISVDGNGTVTIKNQNQIFFVGLTSCIAELPVNEEIKNDYTTWGEH